jgi:hypothetical protein
MSAVYLFDDGEQHWIVAESKAQAWEFYRENCEPAPTPEEVTCRKLRDSERLTVTFEDALTDAEKRQTQTVAQWAAEGPVPCLLGSTEW